MGRCLGFCHRIRRCCLHPSSTSQCCDNRESVNGTTSDLNPARTIDRCVNATWIGQFDSKWADYCTDDRCTFTSCSQSGCCSTTISGNLSGRQLICCQYTNTIRHDRSRMAGTKSKIWPSKIICSSKRSGSNSESKWSNCLLCQQFGCSIRGANSAWPSFFSRS